MQAIIWKEDHLLLLDQRRLPHEELWLKVSNSTEVSLAISTMVVRGAPAIAISASYGLALAIMNNESREEAHQQLLNSRPTAVNLQWALERLHSIPDEGVLEEVIRIHQEDIEINHSIGKHGAPLLNGGVLTICNTGALATGGHGTALGMIRSAHANGQGIHVYILETRPYLQGARLTAFECMKEGIPCTLITDGMAGALMAKGHVQSAVAGCDRVALNGDTANKIGTYQLAVLCKAHDIPFYIAMPWSSYDKNCPSGKQIPIEDRPANELRYFHHIPVAPKEVPVWNPAFDVTPHKIINGWVTETGIMSHFALNRI
jgi:methylthioribose-1-phosphate isomerase